jgi:hypothetical protein
MLVTKREKAMTHNLATSEQLAHSTVRIEVTYPDGSIGTGTGFFYRFAVSEDDLHVPAIVTNKHVVSGAATGKFHLTRAKNDGGPDYLSHEVYELPRFETLWTMHPNPNIDLCAMPIAPLLHKAKTDGKNLFYITIDQSLIPTAAELADLEAMEEVAMIGYPNGIWDRTHNMPVFRRGITATHPNLDWNGKPEFLIDAACFPGSSGSPVLLYNPTGFKTKSGGLVLGQSRTKLLGILYGGPQYTVTGDVRIMQVPTADIPVSISRIPNNLGMVIKARELKPLDEIFSELLSRELSNSLPARA